MVLACELCGIVYRLGAFLHFSRMEISPVLENLSSPDALAMMRP
jgi:hypothetical protein